MDRSRITDRLFLLAGVLLAPVFLPPYAELLGEPVRTAVGGPAKLFFLLLAAAFAARSARRFSPRSPARTAWLLLAVGLLLYSCGQLTLVVYQLVLAVSSPFPSLADAFFIPAACVLIAALICLLQVYRRSGLPFDAKRDFGWVGAGSLLVLGTVVAFVLRPVVASSTGGLGLLLNLAYPISDLALLVPSLILLRVSWRLRGGSVAKVWLALVVGFVAIAAGDVAFAYFSEMGVGGLDSVIDLLFLAGYMSIARGALAQDEIAG
ncbi:MAG TPA: hypothetical protein VGG06_11535 [Thermoanaerobaculia bacterium]|jgi:hypothetical protein